MLKTLKVFNSHQYFCSLFQFLLCMPGAGGPTESGDAAGISPTLLEPRGISPTRPACCLLGPTTTGELLPKIHHPALPFPTTPATHSAGGRVSRAPSVHAVYATATSLSQKQGKVHMSAQLQGGGQSIETPSWPPNQPILPDGPAEDPP